MDEVTGTTRSADPRSIEWMHRLRWYVVVVFGVVFVFYQPEWPFAQVVSSLSVIVAVVFFNARWGYRVWDAFRAGYRGSEAL